MKRMTHMKEVADIIGVKLGERFKVRDPLGNITEYVLTEYGLTSDTAYKEKEAYKKEAYKIDVGVLYSILRNHMKEVADILGVKLGERFKVRDLFGNIAECILTEDSLTGNVVYEEKEATKEEAFQDVGMVLYSILMGVSEIIRSKPSKVGDE